MEQPILRTRTDGVRVMFLVLVPFYLVLGGFFLYEDAPIEVAFFLTLFAGVPVAIVTEKLARKSSARKLSSRGVESTAQVIAIGELMAHSQWRKLDLDLAVQMPQGVMLKVKHAAKVPVDLAGRLLKKDLLEITIQVVPDEPRLLLVDWEKTRSRSAGSEAPASEIPAVQPTPISPPGPPLPPAAKPQTNLAAKIAMGIVPVAIGMLVLFSVTDMKCESGPAAGDSDTWFTGLIFLGCGFLSLVFTAVRWLRAQSLKRRGIRVEVPAQIHQVGSSSRRRIKLVARFTDGQGNKYRLESMGSNTAWAALEGEPIGVIYDPDNPARAVIEQDLGMGSRLGLLLGLGFMLLGAGMVLFS